MDKEIKPIETQYGGYKFRSRTEARWAVFFDTIGFKWQYEEDGYELANGRWYLPDFKIITPNQKIYYCEVKPIEFDNFENDNIYDYRLFTKLVNKPIIILTGQPSYMAYHLVSQKHELPVNLPNEPKCSVFSLVFFKDWEPYIGNVGDDNAYWIHYFTLDENSGHWHLNCDERAARKAFGDKYIKAINAAKMERFDKI